MRNNTLDSNDTIWGLWEADEKSEEIWDLRTSLLEEYGLKLDVVYDDPSFSISKKYVEIFNVSSDSLESLFASLCILAIVLATLVLVAVFFYFKVKNSRKKSKVSELP